MTSSMTLTGASENTCSGLSDVVLGGRPWPIRVRRLPSRTRGEPLITATALFSTT